MPAADHRLAGWLALASIVLTGCSSAAEEPAGLPTSANPTSAATAPSPAASPSPSPEPGVAVDLPPGLELHDVPEVTGTELRALETYLRFEAEYWQSLLDSEVSEQVASLAADEVAQEVTDQVDVQVEDDFHLGGTLRIRPEIEGTTGNIAVVSACLDQSEVTVVRGGDEEISEDSATNPTFSVTADLANRGDRWVVTSYRMEFEPC